MFNLYLYTSVCRCGVNLKLIAISQRALRNIRHGGEDHREGAREDEREESGKSLTYLLSKCSTTSTHSLTDVQSTRSEDDGLCCLSSSAVTMLYSTEMDTKTKIQIHVYTM